MFGHIYKLSDNKWHLYSTKFGWADCGADMDTMKEERMIGQGRKECQKDPDVSTVCPKCFHFLPHFQPHIQYDLPNM